METEEQKDIKGIYTLFAIFVASAILIVAGYQILTSLMNMGDLPLWIQGIIVGLFFLFVYSIRDRAKRLFDKYLGR